jgi:hypothetical protein
MTNEGRHSTYTRQVITAAFSVAALAVLLVVGACGSKEEPKNAPATNTATTNANKPANSNVGVVVSNANTNATATNTANANHAANTNATAAKNTNAAATSGKPILGNSATKLYHKPGCPNYDKIAPKNQVKFATEEDAQKAGYKKAGDCP